MNGRHAPARGRHDPRRRIIRHTDALARLPVTGGTGAYAGARGQVTITEDDARKLTVMRLELLQ